ncbi:MAG: Uma2 family endonuclease [Armatimonadetes bacterium]|nr:Uma2 family endonuclease [Armatimonadota bacterium]
MAVAPTIERAYRAPQVRGGAGIPRLQSGDRLTRIEFERRYRAMPQLKKAELVEGVVYMPSPVSMEHARPCAALAGWALAYVAATRETEVAQNATVILDSANEVQPDVLIRQMDGGTSRINADSYIEGPPEFVMEVAYSTASYDLHDKRRVYERTGVGEYLVWRVQDGQLDWWALREQVFVPMAEAEIMKSGVLPGLWLNRSAMLAGDLQAVLATLQEGLASSEHAGFVRSLVATT